MDRIDKIYIINLKYRTDRLEHIIGELNKVNVDKNKVEIIEAVYEPELGALGCAKSHIIALEKFIFSKNKNCLILEDDFSFVKDRKYIDNKLNSIINNDWDVIMFSGNIRKIDQINESFAKVIEIWTTSGYLVNQNYASKILDNFKESREELQSIYNKVKENNKKFETENIEYQNHIQKLLYYKLNSQIKNYPKPTKLMFENFSEEISKYNIDQHWKNLQKKDNWFIFYPTVGEQYANYSDISKINVKYNC